MEFIDSIWQVGIIALLAGAMIGALAYRFLSPSVKQSDGLKAELDDTLRELNDYKESVNRHFNKTSALVNDLTQNYVRVYQHLAEGAQTLGDSRALNNLLEQQQGKVLLTVDNASESQEDARDPVAASARVIPDVPPDPVVDSPAPDIETAGDDSAQSTEPGADETAASEAAGPEARGDGAETESEPAPEASASDEPGTDGKTAADDAPKEAKAGTPVIDVDRIDGASDDKSSPRAKAGSVIAEPTEGIEVPTTRH